MQNHPPMRGYSMAVLLLLLAVSSAIFLCAPFATAQNFTLDLVHFGVRRANMLPVQSSGLECGFDFDPVKFPQKCTGGFSRWKRYIDDLRGAGKNVLAVDSGGSMSGSLWFELFNSTFQGQVYSSVGIQYSGLEYSELPNGPETLTLFASGAGNVSVLAGNIYGHGPELQGNAVHMFGPTRVGIVSVADDGLLSRVKNPGSYVENVTAIDSLRAQVGAMLDSGINIIVAIAPITAPDDQVAVIQQMTGLDVILVQRDPVSFSYPTILTAVSGSPLLMLSTSTFFRDAGHMQLTFDQYGKIVAYNGSLVKLNVSTNTPDPTLEATLAANWQVINYTQSEVIAYTTANIDYSRDTCRSFQCTPGNLLADALLWFARQSDTSVVGSFYNAGTINNGFTKTDGSITLLDTYNMNPFGRVDFIYTVDISGFTLKTLLEYSVSVADAVQTASITGRFLQVAGISFAFNPNTTVGFRVFNVTVGGVPLDGTATYRFVTIDYIVFGGDGYGANVGFPSSLISRSLVPVLFDSLTVSYLKAHNPISPVIDGRISFTDQVYVPPANATPTTAGSASTDLTPIIAPLASILGASLLFLVVIMICAFCCLLLLVLAVFCIIIIGIIVLAVVIVVAVVASGGGVFAAVYSRRKAKTETGDLQMLLSSYMADADYRELRIKDLEFAEKIGSGAYGDVYRGYWKQAEVAIKTLHGQTVTQNMLEEIRTEARLMKKLGNHPNIVTLLGAVTKDSDTFCIVTQFCEHGSLSSILLDPSIPLSLLHLARMARDAARGLSYLHHEDVIHCDIAARNCLVNANGTVLLSDFGEAKMLGGLNEVHGTRDVGPVRWMAPESIRKRVLSKSADCFMFGVLLWEITHRDMPYRDMEVVDVMFGVIQDGLRPPVAPGVHPIFAAIMAGVWHDDPAARLTVDDILKQLDMVVDSLGGDRSTEYSASEMTDSEVVSAARMDIGGVNSSDSEGDDGNSYFPLTKVE